AQSIEQYLTELKTQAKLCSFICAKDDCNTSYEERMIRDRLILGINDKQIQARLIREPDITTTKIVDYCKSIALSKQHLKTLNQKKKFMPCERDVKTFQQEKKLCGRCLYEHVPRRCPAYGKTCASCQGIGHFAKACFKNKMRNKTDEDIDPHNVFQEKERRKILYNAKEADQHETRQQRGEKQVRSLEEVHMTDPSSSNQMYINACNQGVWKKNFLSLVFKSGNRNDIQNNRGIPKVFESLITDEIFNDFKHVIIDEQHGFYKGKSTATNFAVCQHFITNKLEQRLQVDVIYTDLAKTFDCLS
ncbi:hypothetical protein JTB14_022389, partial [Gonioctena quinquepunctata]